MKHPAHFTAPAPLCMLRERQPRLAHPGPALAQTHLRQQVLPFNRLDKLLVAVLLVLPAGSEGMGKVRSARSTGGPDAARTSLALAEPGRRQRLWHWASSTATIGHHNLQGEACPKGRRAANRSTHLNAASRSSSRYTALTRATAASLSWP